MVIRGERGARYGQFVEATAEGVVIRPGGGGPARISRDRITGMSVQRGYRSQALKGGLFGVGLGIVAGLIVHQAAEDPPASAPGTVGIGVAAGIPLGLLVGWMIRSPEWDGVDMSALMPRPAPSPVPHRR